MMKAKLDIWELRALVELGPGQHSHDTIKAKADQIRHFPRCLWYWLKHPVLREGVVMTTEEEKPHRGKNRGS